MSESLTPERLAEIGIRAEAIANGCLTESPQVALCRASADLIDLRDEVRRLREIVGKLPQAEESPLDKPLGTLPLSVRARRRLAGAGVTTIRQLVESSESELAHIRGFGKTCLREVHRVLAARGLELRGPVQAEE